MRLRPYKDLCCFILWNSHGRHHSESDPTWKLAPSHQGRTDRPLVPSRMFFSGDSHVCWGATCVGTCPQVVVEWSVVGSEFGLKSRDDWIKSWRVTYASIGSLGQIMAAETLPFGYLLLQLVFMSIEACYGSRRQPGLFWIASSALSVTAILYLGLFGPTSSPFMYCAFTLTGVILCFTATLVTANEAIPVTEFSLMVMIFLMQGVAAITYSSVVRTFVNLLMGLLISTYGLFVGMPVVGFPIFYLLIL